MEKPEDNHHHNQLGKAVNRLVALVFFLLLIIVILVYFLMVGVPDFSTKPIPPNSNPSTPFVVSLSPEIPLPEGTWTAPDTNTIPKNEMGKLIRYGRNLIAHTSEYIGPNGKVAALTNGMNCQNCHLDAGTKPFGNNYSAVYSTYPKFRDRSGGIETMEKRVNDCIQRSLNGKPLDEESREMKAMLAYFKWLGSGVKKGVSPIGSGIQKPVFMNRAADVENGKILYNSKCVTCHKQNGEGQLDEAGNNYVYPPLWGNNSYNTGAGLFRISRFAGYIKYNMPLGASYGKPQLSDDEAWDIAAYVNSMDRPHKEFKEDWPDISAKPSDHPFGPFSDNYSQEQHKYGPFIEMEKHKKKKLK